MLSELNFLHIAHILIYRRIKAILNWHFAKLSNTQLQIDVFQADSKDYFFKPKLSFQIYFIVGESKQLCVFFDMVLIPFQICIVCTYSNLFLYGEVFRFALFLQPFYLPTFQITVGYVTTSKIVAVHLKGHWTFPMKIRLDVAVMFLAQATSFCAR